jgi:hypothetical protein
VQIITRAQAAGGGGGFRVLRRRGPYILCTADGEAVGLTRRVGRKIPGTHFC